MSFKLPSRRLVSQQDSAMIKRPDVPRSKFSGSWTRKTAFNAGALVPILIEEVLPGDHLKYDVTAYIRMATPKFPLFDNQRVDTFFFFVPNRLVWTNWKKFMGEQATPATSIDITIPKRNATDAGLTTANTLYDHLGLPVGNIAASQSIQFNALPLRGYALIWNEWFRDQNLQDSVAVDTGDSDSTTNTSLLNRAKAHDYFTSCLPWPQKFTAPSVALGGLAPVTGLGTTASGTPNTGPYSIEETGSATSYDYYYDGGTPGSVIMDADSGGGPQVYADLSAASGVAINTLRQAWLIQMLLERDARGGTRYTEIVRSHFGVQSPDARLQRPEYIGGGSSPINITPVANTVQQTGESWVTATVGGAGTAAGSHRASYAATEHGFIIGLINVRSELSYSQGLHKMWTRSTRYDYYWPSLAGLGEQAVLRQEIYCTGDDTADATVFGYQERWHEYRTRTSEVVGVFRPKVSSNIDEWHLSQEFTTPPTLGTTFIQDTPPMSRVLAAGSSADKQQYLADILFRREAVRPIPMFGTPAAIGRF